MDATDGHDEATAARLADLEARLNDACLRLNELHHRVNNSLQMIVALLDMQAAQSPPEAARALYAARNRVSAIATLYATIRLEDDAAAVDLAGRLADLVTLHADMLPAHVHIAYRRGVEACLLPATLAANLLIVVNELITNAVQHAFPDGRRGDIIVDLGRSGEGYLLAVVDDGVGMSWSQDAFGFGLGIARGLVERSGGRIETVAQEGGVHVQVLFNVAPPGGA